MERSKITTDAEVEREIARLRGSVYVQLAKAEERKRYRRRQYMYALRVYERKGMELARQGITLDSLENDDEEGLE